MVRILVPKDLYGAMPSLVIMFVLHLQYVLKLLPTMPQRLAIPGRSSPVWIMKVFYRVVAEIQATTLFIWK